MTDDNVVGVFTGLESSLYEYVAKIIAPYRPDFQLEIGTLLLVQSINENIVARDNGLFAQRRVYHRHGREVAE